MLCILFAPILPVLPVCFQCLDLATVPPKQCAFFLAVLAPFSYTLRTVLARGFSFGRRVP